MSTKTKILLCVLISFSAASTAVADKLCLQSTVNKKTFKVTNKSVVAATCPKGYTALADTSSFQGPAGATGAAGILNFGACRTVFANCDHFIGENTCTASCNNGEFVLQHEAVADQTCVGDYAGSSILYPSQYANGLGTAVKFYSLSCTGLDLI